MAREYTFPRGTVEEQTQTTLTANYTKWTIMYNSCNDAYLRAMDTVQAPVLYIVCDLLPLSAPSLTFPSASPNTKEVCSGGHTIHVTALWTMILLQITFFSPLISTSFYEMTWLYFIFSPGFSDLVHKHNIVRLSHSNLGGVRGEGKTCHLVAFLTQLQREKKSMQ